GHIIFGEPVAAGLACDGSHYYNKDWLHAARYVMSPPLSRDPSTPTALMDMLAASMAAKIFNLYPRKGRIAAGSDADIVIWNPNKKRTISKDTHHQAVDFNIFEGMTVYGVAETTISRGVVVWSDNKLSVRAGAGRFIPMKPFSPAVFSSVPHKARAMAPKAVKRSKAKA
ncbi:Amidohydrolase 1 domain containing protein, partial [Trichostrongylus colubriformis]